MTYQVFARKWRPKSFAELIGQPHVTKVLIHALTSLRLHHAYLFTGTRGIGKTTLARILAKSLNCEQGVTPTPCGVCQACQEIDAGRFTDLLEVDAASRTRIEETRDLLDNVPYLPTKGRFKIYLIDEVHMLSTNSFNALLKTLEEPPSHVKFILATTDPQRVPVTVLSRCLRFTLRPISSDEIAKQLQRILQTENITSEKFAIQLLAKAGKGSMRDALSLLEQAIGLGAGEVTTTCVKEMLGLVHEELGGALLEKLLRYDALGVYAVIQNMAQLGIDFEQVLEQLLLMLHTLVTAKMVPQVREQILKNDGMSTQLLDYSEQLLPEELQLFYQIGIMGRRDFGLAPDPRTGFEMLLLRMLAFQPKTTVPKFSKPIPTPLVEKKVRQQIERPDWDTLVQALPLKGLSQVLIKHCIVRTWTEEKIILLLDKKQAMFLNSARQEKIIRALNTYLGKSYRISIEVDCVENDTPIRKAEKVQQDRCKKSEEQVKNNPVVQQLIKTFGATIEQVMPVEEENNL